MISFEEDTVLVFAILLPLLYLTAILFAIHVLNHGRTSQGTIAWFVALIGMPYIAVPLYSVLGFHRFNGYVNARREGDFQLSHISKAILETTDIENLLVDNRTPFETVASTLAIMPFTKGSSARLLIDGEATFEAIFKAIDAAKDYVLVQFFIIKDDELSRELKRLLIEKARAGLRVSLLYDDVGSHALPRRFIRELRNAGVTVSSFATFTHWKNRFRINFRNHRKIVVVDGQVAFVGGHNVGNEYVGKSHFGRWRDTHVEMRGPIVQAVQLVFCEDWFWATEQTLDLDWRLRAVEEPGIAALALPSGPADDRETCTLFFVDAINSARERLWIVSPYFVPDVQVLTALELAVMRGVDVRVMLPAKADHLLVYLSSFTFLNDAEGTGVRFYRYEDGFLHQKVMLIDDNYSMIGTANFDNRSFRINFEITMIFADPDFNRQVEQMLIEDFAQCREVDEKEFLDKPIWYKQAARVARLMAPIQ